MYISYLADVIMVRSVPPCVLYVFSKYHSHLVVSPTYTEPHMILLFLPPRDNHTYITNCWMRHMFLALIKCFEVILMSKSRWPPISRYEIVKTSDENYNNATMVVSLFTYPIIVSSITNPPSSSTTKRCARPSPYIMMMSILITWLQYDMLQQVSTYRNSGNKP